MKNRFAAIARYVFFMAVCVFGASLVIASPVLAQGSIATDNLVAAGEASGISTTATLPEIVGRVIYVILSVLGIVLLGYILLAGYTWMNAGGDGKKVEEAQKMIRNAVIGLVIIASSFAITAFILNLLGQVTGGGGTVTSTGGAVSGFPGSASSLGNGVIEYHIPARDATDVPRNTAIAITFKEPMKISALVQDYNDNGTPAVLTDDTVTNGLNTGVIRIYETGQREQSLATDQVRVRFTADRKTFVFKPVNPIGSPTVNKNYTVELLPTLLREDGRPAFQGSFSNGYKWQFAVSTIIDVTPPQITSVIPVPDSQNPPNVIAQINFSEPIDPTSAAGLYRPPIVFQNVAISSLLTTAPPLTTPFRPLGEFKVSNQYATVEFVPDNRCGVNACGRPIFCLPIDSRVTMSVKAATLAAAGSPQAALTASGYDGVVDMAGNSLDGSANGTAEGQTLDSKTWNFVTQHEPILTGPLITTTVPGPNASNVDPAQKPQATFDGPLQASTVNSNSVYISTNEPAGNDSFWFVPLQTLVNSSGAPLTPTDTNPRGQVTINHRLYAHATDRRNPPMYDPVFTSEVQNIYQNCFKPAGSASCTATDQNPNCCDGVPQAGGCNYP